MKLNVHVLFVTSALFVNCFRGNIMTTNLMSKKKHVRIHHTLLHVNATEQENLEPVETSDPIERYSEWFGLFPKEQKWKNVRFTFYIIVAGYFLGEAGTAVKDFISNNNQLHDYFT